MSDTSEGYDEPGCSCIHETGMAILVVIPGQGGRSVWIPKKCLHDDSEVYGLGDEGKLIVHEWWATKQGWL